MPETERIEEQLRQNKTEERNQDILHQHKSEKARELQQQKSLQAKPTRPEQEKVVPVTVCTIINWVFWQEEHCITRYKQRQG